MCDINRSIVKKKKIHLEFYYQYFDEGLYIIINKQHKV